MAIFRYSIVEMIEIRGIAPLYGEALIREALHRILALTVASGDDR